MPRSTRSAPKLVDFRELKDTAKGEELQALTEAILGVLGFEPYRGGRGPDGGKDLRCIQTVSSDLATYKRRWLVQCKHHAQSGKAVNEAHIGDIIGDCRKHDADGFLVVTTSTLTNELVKKLEAISAGKQDNIVTGYWDEHRLRELLMRPEQEDVLKRFLPESYARVQKLKPVKVLLATLESQGLTKRQVDAIGRQISEYQKETASNGGAGSPSLALYPAATLHRDQLDKAATVFRKGLPVDHVAKYMEGLPYEEWTSLVDAFRAEPGDGEERVEELLHHLAADATEEDQRFAAVRRLVSDYDYGLDDVLEFMPRLDRESIELLASDLELDSALNEALRDHALNEHISDLEELPPHLQVVDVWGQQRNLST